MSPLPFALRVVPALALSLALVSCGDDDDTEPLGPGPEDGGVAATLVSRPAGGIGFQQFALRGWLKAWEEDEGSPPGASWSWDDATMTWAHDTWGTSTVYVGVAGGRSTEIRTRQRNRLNVVLTRDTARVREFRDADRMTIAMEDTVRHYVLDPEVYEIDDPYEIVTTGTYALDITGGKLEAVAGTGTVTGWERSNAEGTWAIYRVAGEFALTFGYAGGFDPCAAERLEADILVMDDAGAELDRYAGSFSVDQGGPVYSGFLDSEEGPGRYGVNGSRSCP